MNEPTVIAYPVANSPSRMSNASIAEENIYSSSLGDSKFADDTIEMSGNFFSQLDSMIAAVKMESTALDSMKEKLKEVENLRNQISTFTKRLLDADQANLNLKANLVKVQEMYAEVKKQKADVESSIVPLRTELNRTKEQLNKERAGRIAAQQLVAQLKDQVSMLEAANEGLDREVKTIPALTESNDILKNDLAQLRRRYKEEKAHMTKHIKNLEAQSRDVEAIKGAVRDLSMRLLDVASGGASPSSGSVGQGLPNAGAFLAQQQHQQQLRMQPQMAPLQQAQRYPPAPVVASTSAGYYPAQGAYSQHQHQHHQQQQALQHQLEQQDDNSYEEDSAEEEDEGEDSADYEGGGGAGSAVLSAVLTAEYENDSFAELNSSLESVGSVAAVGKQPGAAVSAGNGGGGSGAAKGNAQAAGAGSSSGKKKKKVRKLGASQPLQGQMRPQQQQQQQQPRMMQQLDGAGNLHHHPHHPHHSLQHQQQQHQQQQGQHMYQQPQQYRAASQQQQQHQSQSQAQAQGFSLPRI